ncbi:hypothetical protein [Paenibacillus sp. CF384]|uniref:hypothetical protein n=1 Tax=Paenibacillus sp. CF384 TaxID=1884382 RepID=UPI0008952976|nr:hypothetical protein [Paenibacillus sp. CF384]SDX44152.1 hypothetical protein SAMN05518855_101413 [Paenibacillus sp. CF384]
MNKTMKALGLTAAIAVMIPLSAYAATSATPTTSDSAKSTTTATSTVVVGQGPFGLGGKGEVMKVRAGGFYSQEVLDLLKLDMKALKEKIEAGKTLAQIAEEQGVTRDQLKATMTAAFEKRQAEEKKDFTENLDKSLDSTMKDNIGFGRGGERGGNFKMEFKKGIRAEIADFSASAKVLGLSDEELKTALSGGKSLADLAQEKGIDVQKLIDAQKQVIVDNLNAAVKAGKLTQAEADKEIAKAADIATRIVNGKMDRKPHTIKIDRNGVKQDASTKADTGTSAAPSADTDA